MKVGNIVSGLEIVDVKRVNKLNLIQFLKEVDSYLQQDYRIDVNSARQVGLVLSVDVYKTEAACSQKVGTTEVTSTVAGSTGVKEETKDVEDSTTEVVQAESTPVEDTPEKKPTTTRSKKTTQ